MTDHGLTAPAGIEAGHTGATTNRFGLRPVTTYSTWAGANPILADPNADADGDSNWLEYAAGTEALDPQRFFRFSANPTGTGG